MAETSGNRELGARQECVQQVTVDDAAKDSEVLLQLVESCLFMHGEMVMETDIVENLGIPRDAIKKALNQLTKRYEGYGGAIRVREIDEGCWLMDLQEDVSEHVDMFYIEQKPYTRSEVMTLAFVAFMQPLPRQILAFYRGTNAAAHAWKWIDAGFVKETSITRDDARLKDLVQKYQDDRAMAKASAQGAEDDKARDGKAVNKPDTWLGKEAFTCYTTTPRFSGYFNLSNDLAHLKKELENWKEIYRLFD
nr:SMC-Scp complex subunit ScpB [Candidatus Sigynarchaeota archaeon]